MDRLLAREVFNLVVLDLMLPGEDGLTACRRLRGANNQIPIIMLTAKGDELSRIKGLELGADDYLAKPFNPDELMARVKAVLRRQSTPVPGAPGSEDESVSFGDYELSLATRELNRGPQGAGDERAPAADPRQADESGPWPRMGCPGAFHRCTDLPLAPDDRTRPFQATLHPDCLGCGLRVRSGRHCDQVISHL
jgi:hypothetical protein